METKLASGVGANVQGEHNARIPHSCRTCAPMTNQSISAMQARARAQRVGAARRGAVRRRWGSAIAAASCVLVAGPMHKVETGNNCHHPAVKIMAASQ